MIIDGQKQGHVTTIAQKYNKTSDSVESAMRKAINRAWTTNDIEDLEEYYTVRVSSEKGVPTVSEFVFYYAGKMRAER